MSIKTNAMRILERLKIDYTEYTYDGVVSGVDVARVLNQNPDNVFKTLVTVGNSGEHYVFIVPVEKELDLKKGAKLVGEKWVEMIKSKELLPLTGYIHGGCSPFGMKKQFKTIAHISAEGLSKMFVSGGKIGIQVEIPPAALARGVGCTFHDIIK